MKHLLLLTSLALAIAGHGQTTVLFVGNSYTYVNDLPGTFREVALSLGDTVEVGMSAPGGFTLQDHYFHEPTMEAIGSEQWDFVVMQEQSQWGALLIEGATTTHSAAMIICDSIEANYECTYPVFFMTWGYENGDDLNCPAFPNVCTYAGMQQNIREGYLHLGEFFNGYISPVGMAWKEVRETHPLIDLYQADGSHPTPEGTYLAACVFYCTLFQQDCLNASFNGGLSPDTAAVLRQIASGTVLDSMTTWNLDVANGTSAIWSLLDFTPDSYTLYHPGQGTHFWSTSYGATSTSGQPTFTFPRPGWYTITHIYTDPCGNSDTLVSPPFEVYATGIETQGSEMSFTIGQVGPGALEALGGTGRERITLHDLRGRVLVEQKLNVGRTSVSCPPGFYVWSVQDQHGTTWSGKVLVEE